MEVWKPWPNQPIIEVSSLGRLGRTWASGRKIYTPVWMPYAQVATQVGGVRYTIRPHVAVLEAFVGSRPPNHQAAHLDGDKRNNRLDNLQWKLPVDNSADRELHGYSLRGEGHGMAKLTADNVRAIRSASGSHREIALQYGVTRSTVTAIRAGRRWSHV